MCGVDVRFLYKSFKVSEQLCFTKERSWLKAIIEVVILLNVVKSSRCLRAMCGVDVRFLYKSFEVSEQLCITKERSWLKSIIEVVILLNVVKEDSVTDMDLRGGKHELELSVSLTSAHSIQVLPLLHASSSGNESSLSTVRSSIMSKFA